MLEAGRGGREEGRGILFTGGNEKNCRRHPISLHCHGVRCAFTMLPSLSFRCFLCYVYSKIGPVGTGTNINS